MQVIKSFDAQLRAWWLEWGEMRDWQCERDFGCTPLLLYFCRLHFHFILFHYHFTFITTDPFPFSFPAPYIQIAVDFYYNYAALVLNSFGLQNALECSPSGTSHSSSPSYSVNTSYFFSKVHSAAHRCAILARDKLGPSGYTKFLPDTVFIQMSYAVLSLLKVQAFVIHNSHLLIHSVYSL